MEIILQIDKKNYKNNVEFQYFQCCPACGSTLLTFHEKHGEIQAGRTGTVGGGNKRSQTGGNVNRSTVYEEAITSWYCPKCGVHIIPEQVQ